MNTLSCCAAASAISYARCASCAADRLPRGMRRLDSCATTGSDVPAIGASCSAPAFACPALTAQWNHTAVIVVSCRLLVAWVEPSGVLRRAIAVLRCVSVVLCCLSAVLRCLSVVLCCLSVVLCRLAAVLRCLTVVLSILATELALAAWRWSEFGSADSLTHRCDRHARAID